MRRGTHVLDERADHIAAPALRPVGQILHLSRDMLAVDIWAAMIKICCHVATWPQLLSSTFSARQKRQAQTYMRHAGDAASSSLCESQPEQRSGQSALRVTYIQSIAGGSDSLGVDGASLGNSCVQRGVVHGGVGAERAAEGVHERLAGCIVACQTEGLLYAVCAHMPRSAATRALSGLFGEVICCDTTSHNRASPAHSTKTQQSQQGLA